MMKKEKKKEIVLTVCMLIAGITEPFLFNTSFKNLTLFFLGAYLWEALEKKKEEKEIGFFVKQGKRVVCLNAEKFLSVTESLYTVWHKHKRKILVCSISLSVVIGSVYATMKEMPKAYIVPRVHADVREATGKKELWCLDNPEDPIYQDVMILDYADETTYMEYIDGDALGMERIRLYISSILLLGVLFTGMGITVTAIKDRKA